MFYIISAHSFKQVQTFDGTESQRVAVAVVLAFSFFLYHRKPTPVCQSVYNVNKPGWSETLRLGEVNPVICNTLQSDCLPFVRPQKQVSSICVVSQSNLQLKCTGSNIFSNIGVVCVHIFADEMSFAL